MKKGFVVALLSLICSGCAYFYHPTHEQYARMLATWPGHGTKDLYEEWGYPNSIQQIDDNTFLETYYTKKFFPYLRPISQIADSKHQFTDKWEAKVNSFDIQSIPESYNCRTSFIAVNDIIVDYSYEGSGCVE